ncbi:MAG: GNAT family N-acetyltransferase [Actinomycetota bacterium]|nr:GNAT family N-acetyltransferase [Actinomycetota bacterium]
MSLHIRPATTADARVLAAFRGRMFVDMGHAEESAPEILDAAAAYMERAIPVREYFAWIAEEVGTPVGSVGALIVTGPPMVAAPSGQIARLQNVFVTPEYRGRGIARDMLAAAMAGLKGIGIGHVALVASDAGRPVYERMGFEPIPEMRRSLADWPPENAEQ